MSDLNTTVDMLHSRHCTSDTPRFDHWFGVGSVWKVQDVVEEIRDNVLRATYLCRECTNPGEYAWTLVGK